MVDGASPGTRTAWRRQKRAGGVARPIFFLIAERKVSPAALFSGFRLAALICATIYASLCPRISTTPCRICTLFNTRHHHVPVGLAADRNEGILSYFIGP